MGWILEFFKGRIGSSLIFFGLVFTVFYFVREYRERKQEAQAKATAQKVNVAEFGQVAPESVPPDPAEPQVREWVKERAIDLFRPKRPSPPVIDIPSPQAKAKTSKALPALVHEHTASKPKRKAKQTLEWYAPRGTLVPCQLVNTIDTGDLFAPIIGLVTSDVWHNQQLIVPAGTRVHYTGQFERRRDRVAAEGLWTFVWNDGREYRIRGVALDREYLADSDRYGLTDGSAGIRGRILNSDSLRELKLFSATAIAAAARSSEDTVLTLLGSKPANSLQNAGLEGGAAVADQYAQLLRRQIDGDGLFVRATAGTEFYIYLLDVFEPELASVAGLTQEQQRASQSASDLARVLADDQPAEILLSARERAALLKRREALIHLHRNGEPFLSSTP